MRIAVITCPRADGVSYLQQTLEDLLLQDPSVRPRDVKVFSDSLDPPGVPAGVQVEASDQSRLERIERDELKGMLNQIRAMKWAAEGGEYGCVLEDDVLFAGDWHARSVKLAKSLDVSTQGQAWCLTLQHWFADLKLAFDVPGPPSSEEPGERPYRFPWMPESKSDSAGAPRNMGDADKSSGVILAREPAPDRTLKWNGKIVLWGSQGYMLPYVTMRKTAELFERKLRLPPDVRRFWRMDEGFMRAQREEELFTMFAADPCLLRHVGEQSHDWPDQTLEWRTAPLFDEGSRRRI